MSAASVIRVARNSGSARRADGDRSRRGGSPVRTLGVVAAISSRSRQSLRRPSFRPCASSARDRGAVALHRVNGRLVLALQGGRDRGVGQLLDGVLAVVDQVGEERLQAGGLVLV